jgi:hypothetical protein
MENNMNITSVQYCASEENPKDRIVAIIDGETLNVPLDPNNRHYAEILKQVEAGTLTIADAE